MKRKSAKPSDVADKLRKCYQFERNQYARNRGTPDDYRVPPYWRSGGPAGKKDTVWHSLARFCRRRQIDPISYVQWCLSMEQLLLHDPPEPNQLLAVKRMEAYVAGREKRRERIALRLRIEKRLAEAEFAYHRAGGDDPEDAWVRALSHSKLELSPLFRYALTSRLGGERFGRIAREFEPYALLQYQRDPEDYDATWRGLRLPPDFAGRAAALYERLLDREP